MLALAPTLTEAMFCNQEFETNSTEIGSENVSTFLQLGQIHPLFPFLFAPQLRVKTCFV